MNIKSLKSISYFSISDAIKLTIGLLFPKLAINSSVFKFLLKEKREIDFLYRNNSVVKKFAGNQTLISGTRNVNADYLFYLRRYSSDVDVFKQIYYRPDYPILIKKISTVFNGSENVKNVIDGGAYIGLSTFYWASSFPDSHVIAIEAEESNYQLLKKNVEVNKLSNVKILNKAIWYKEAELTVTREKMDKRPWAFAVCENETKIADKVIGVSLYALIKENGIQQIDVLKLDIEGAEQQVFLMDDKVDELLSHTRIVICELHYFNHIRDEIVETLMKNGFYIENIGEDIFCVNQKLLD